MNYYCIIVIITSKTHLLTVSVVLCFISLLYNCDTFWQVRAVLNTARYLLQAPTVMLNYAGEYCDACRAAVTVIRSSDAALKSCLEWLTMSYILGNW